MKYRIMTTNDKTTQAYCENCDKEVDMVVLVFLKYICEKCCKELLDSFYD
jgi:Zn finger protein HypA/HybF involved in hydrogenase expression